MFRENVLTEDDVVDRIAATMVPVAVDRWKAEDRGTPEARFLQPFFARHPPQGSPCIYAPDGRVLGGFDGFHDMARRTRRMIDKALAAFGPVEPRKAEALATHPHRGRGVQPDGSVSLAEYIRPAEKGLGLMNTKSPVVSSVTLDAREFAAFAPARAAAGAEWTLPGEVAKRLARITSPMCFQHAPQPAWVSDVRLGARVEAVEDGVARLGYEGRIASEHRVAGQSVSVQETILTGEGVYDIEGKTMRALMLVGSGTLRWPEAPAKVVAFDALVEWTLEPPAPVKR
jgi:hypothetical protein